MLMDWCS